MQKLILKIYIPSINEYFDVSVPADLEVAILTTLLAEAAEEMFSGRYKVSHQEILLQKYPDRLLDKKRTLSDYGITDGTNLILM